MSKWRLILLGSLLAIPPLILIGAGAFYFWKERLWFIVWWILVAHRFIIWIQVRVIVRCSVVIRIQARFFVFHAVLCIVIQWL